MKCIYFYLLLLPIITFGQESKKLPSGSFKRIIFPKSIKNQSPPSAPTPEYTLNKPFEINRYKVAPKTYDAPKLEDSNIVNTPSDLNPGLAYQKQWNKSNDPDAENIKIIRGNQFLGDFKTKTDGVKIIYRDYQFVDGDRISIWVNGAVMVDNIELEGSFKKLNLGLTKGINKIEFEALNQGTSGPNTAEFQVYDSNGLLISTNRWNLATGFKASIIVVKEE